MIELRHTTERATDDLWVEAYAVTGRGEVASYAHRIPYLDLQDPENKRREIEQAERKVQAQLQRMLDADRGN